VGDSATIALNLTFFGTLGLAILMFLGLFLLVILTLVLAGVGRLLVLSVQALFGWLPKHETLPLARLAGETRRPSNAPEATHDDAAAAPAALKPSGLGTRLRDTVERHPLLPAVRREPPVLAEDWAAAVAAADARAMARARAAAPEIKVTVRELPAPSLPAAKLEAVAPLVESALHQDVPDREDTSGKTEPHETAPSGNGMADTGQAVPDSGAARSFTKPPSSAPLSPLDTGSLMSLNGHAKLLRAKLPANNN
jgi:hypothetical protein